jgi:hypothetical protein
MQMQDCVAISPKQKRRRVHTVAQYSESRPGCGFGGYNTMQPMVSVTWGISHRRVSDDAVQLRWRWRLRRNASADETALAHPREACCRDVKRSCAMRCAFRAACIDYVMGRQRPIRQSPTTTHWVERDEQIGSKRPHFPDLMRHTIRRGDPFRIPLRKGTMGTCLRARGSDAGGEVCCHRPTRCLPSKSSQMAEQP